MNSGEIEIMIHRRDITTDLQGPLNLDDTDYVHNMQSLLLFDNIQNSANLRKRLQYIQQFPPTVFFSQTSSGWSFPPSNSPLVKDFPPNVHLLTLMLPSLNSPFLVRFVHIYEKDDGSSLATPVQLNVNDYFKFASAYNQEEKYLSGTWSINTHKRWNWQTADNQGFSHMKTSSDVKDFVVNLNPAQIATFKTSLK